MPAAIAVAPAVLEAVDHSVSVLTSPGTWLTGGQRAAVVAHARGSGGSANAGEAVDDDLVRAAARRIAAAPSSVTADWVDALESDGLDRLAYVEIVGVVARIAAIDTLMWAVGRRQPVLSAVVAGEPSREIVKGARRTSAWVPIAGPPNAVTALSAVADESEERSRLSTALYLADDRVHTAATGGGARDGLTRPQMELLASRVSHRNDCFY